ncbi:Dipeptide transport system permease protein DppB (TC 3.A.1.5.2) [hydrothermal vent metagenome]|uniref:Dipeptide transport system permease protein DppB (TC 3.A.1.5.2) n=1 Tax=hydrothermal vent metagenome TaxID=652676 RepID=A0A3B0TSP0_9ZZZZ
MNSFLLKRFGQAVLSVWGVITLVFIILQLSGDPTLLMVPEGATKLDIDSLRQQLGFDQPMIVQYGDYLLKLAQFDLGTSYVQNIPVIDIIAPRVFYTLYLTFAAMLVAFGIGLPVGIYIGIFRRNIVSRFLMSVVLVGQSMPTFWSGILLIMLFAVKWEIMPSSGAEGALAIILPAITLGALSMATVARITRTSIIEELGKEYVRASKARGLSYPAVIMRHVMRNASIPLITIAALELSNLLAGAVIVETVFAWPGLGLLAIQSIEARDFPVVQALVLLGAIVYIAVNLLADILYSVVDPRIKLQVTR